MPAEAPKPGIARIFAALAVVLVLGAVLGLLGFYVGRDSTSDARERAGRATTVAEDGARTYQEGLREGREEGLREGREEGYAEGREDGYAGGRSDAYERALAVERFDFVPATFYVVQFAGTANRDDLRINTSERMQPGRSYLLCNTNDLCAQ